MCLSQGTYLCPGCIAEHPLWTEPFKRWLPARASVANPALRGRSFRAYLQVEQLPEGCYLATCANIPGLVAQGRTLAETIEIARDVAMSALAKSFVLPVVLSA